MDAAAPHPAPRRAAFQKAPSPGFSRGSRKTRLEKGLHLNHDRAA